MSIDIQNLLDQYNAEEISTPGSYSWTTDQLLNITAETGGRTIEYLIETWIQDYPKKLDKRYKKIAQAYQEYNHGIRLSLLQSSHKTLEVHNEVKTILSTIFHGGTVQKNSTEELSGLLEDILQIIRSDLTF